MNFTSCKIIKYRNVKNAVSSGSMQGANDDGCPVVENCIVSTSISIVIDPVTGKLIDPDRSADMIKYCLAPNAICTAIG